MVLQRTTKTAATIFYISDVLRDLVPFVQFKKREKHQWGSVTFNKVAGYITNDQKWAKIAPEYGFSTF